MKHFLLSLALLGTALFGAEFVTEELSFNRFPVEWIERQGQLLKNLYRAPVIPEVISIQNGKGLRPLRSAEEIQRYVLPGDIAIYYRPLVRYEEVTRWKEGALEKKLYLIRVLFKGSRHVGIAFRNGRQSGEKFDSKYPANHLCVAHIPSNHTKCDWNEELHFFGGSIHFLRVHHEKDSEKTPEDTSQLLGDLLGKGALNGFDGPMKTEVIMDGVESVQKLKVRALNGEPGAFPKMYCSEFPITLHSLTRNELLTNTSYRGTDVTSDLEQYQDQNRSFSFLIPKGTLVNTLSSQITEYLNQQTQLEGMQRKLIDQLVKMYLEGSADSPWKQLALSKWHGAPVPTWFYMDALLHRSKSGKATTLSKGYQLLYVGSLEKSE